MQRSIGDNIIVPNFCPHFIKQNFLLCEHRQGLLGQKHGQTSCNHLDDKNRRQEIVHSEKIRQDFEGSAIYLH